MEVIDFHTHAFPDALAARAIEKLEAASGQRAFHGGRIRDLQRSMEGAGIAASVLQPVATKASQVCSINDWVLGLDADGIVPFGTLHPDFPEMLGEIERIASGGGRGVKLHPEYQRFCPDDERMFPGYELLSSLGLTVLFHAGKDLGLPAPYRATPERLKTVHTHFPELKMVCAHMGGYAMWEAAEESLLGESVFFDTSYAWDGLGAERLLRWIGLHGPERLLFGTDSPWMDQGGELEKIRSLGLSEREEERILSRNAQELLRL